MELLQSPWLIEFCAFCLNFKVYEDGDYSSKFSTHFSFNIDATPTMTLMLQDSIKLEYDFTYPICLKTLFDPYTSGCGHLFCKSCVFLVASVMIYDEPKASNRESKCPIYRETQVYSKALHTVDLDMLLKKGVKITRRRD